MANATIIASAVAVLVVISAVVAIALNLSATQADGSRILDVPAAYTAEFSVVWRNGLGDGAANGWTTTGKVSVAGSNMDFSVSSAKAGEGEAVVTFTGGELFHGKTCVDPTKTPYEVPAINAAAAAATATPVSDPTGELGACAGGALYGIHAFDADHVFCAVAGKLKWVVGRSYTATITSLVAAASEIAAPANADMTECTGRRRLTEGDGHRRMEQAARAPDSSAWFHEEAKAAHSRNLLANSQKHVCFLHGMGGSGTGSDVNGQNNMGDGSEYWGNLVAQLGMPASQIHPIKVDTTSRGWNNVQDYSRSTVVQDLYYSYIQHYRCDVVFAHSMGNTILGALAGRGKPVRWYETQGPMRGSTSARLADSICSSGGFNAAAYAASFVLGNSGTCGKVSGGYCAGDCSTWSCSCTGRASVKTLAAGFRWNSPLSGCSGTSCPFVNGASAQMDAGNDDTYKNYILGRLCGNSAWGSGGLKGAGLAAIQLLGGYASDSDGMVEMISCAPASDPYGNTFSTNSRSALYKGGMNHQDGTGMTGDSALGSRQPISWFHNMITRGSLGTCPIPGSCSFPGATDSRAAIDVAQTSFCTSDAACSYIGTRHWGSVCDWSSKVVCSGNRCYEYAHSCSWNRCWGMCCGDCKRDGNWWY